MRDISVPRNCIDERVCQEPQRTSSDAAHPYFSAPLMARGNCAESRLRMGCRKFILLPPCPVLSSRHIPNLPLNLHTMHTTSRDTLLQHPSSSSFPSILVIWSLRVPHRHLSSWWLKETLIYSRLSRLVVSCQAGIVLICCSADGAMPGFGENPGQKLVLQVLRSPMIDPGIGIATLRLQPCWAV